MKIKTKLGLGLGLLFILIVLLLTVSIKGIQVLSQDAQNILVANYNTIDYSRLMLIALDEDITTEKSLTQFQNNLKKQQLNITEVGEQDITNKLAEGFEKIKANPKDSLLNASVRKNLTDIMLLNMEAIQRKSLKAEDTANTVKAVISVTGAFCFLLAFILLMNLPGNIANPIRELTDSIKAIAAKNYSQRVYFEGHKEFGDLALSFNKMASKLEEFNHSNLDTLLMEKKRIETLINKMHNPVIGLDEAKKIIFINDEALKVTGLNHEETIGKKAQDIAANNDLIRTLIRDLGLPAALTGQKENNLIKIFANGKESFFNKEMIRIEIIPTGEKTSRYIGDVILLQNITPFKELDAAKTNFISTVSHELKTPISSMMMSLQLLENEHTGLTNESQKQLIQSLKEDASRLLKITGELLHMTKVETGLIQLNLQQIDPKSIIQYAIEATKTEAEQNHIQIEMNYPDHLPAINADAEKTTWVIINLLSNAIHYSNQNSKVIVSVTEQVLGPGSSLIKFSVQDFGKGIENQYKERIFDRYFQIPGSSKSGTGLGLAICKEFIEAQGGTIELQSEIGSGSTFSVSLKRDF